MLSLYSLFYSVLYSLLYLLLLGVLIVVGANILYIGGISVSQSSIASIYVEQDSADLDVALSQSCESIPDHSSVVFCGGGEYHILSLWHCKVMYSHSWPIVCCMKLHA